MAKRMADKLVCPVCDGSAENVCEVRRVQVGRRSALVEAKFARCQTCEEEFYLPGQMDAAQRAASEKIRKENGLLMPDEIRSIRDRYGLNQDEFEKLIGAGKKTVTRWENGTVFQNGTADTLMRVLREVPQAALRLARARNVTLQLSEKTRVARRRISVSRIEGFQAGAWERMLASATAPVWFDVEKGGSQEGGEFWFLSGGELGRSDRVSRRVDYA